MTKMKAAYPSWDLEELCLSICRDDSSLGIRFYWSRRQFFQSMFSIGLESSLLEDLKLTHVVLWDDTTFKANATECRVGLAVADAFPPLLPNKNVVYLWSPPRRMLKCPQFGCWLHKVGIWNHQLILFSSFLIAIFELLIWCIIVSVNLRSWVF